MITWLTYIIIILFSQAEDSWQNDCRVALKHRLCSLNKIHLYDVWQEPLIEGIKDARKLVWEKDSEALTLCLAAIATMEQESMYQFRIGSDGEVGPFQFKLPTAREALKKYNLPYRYSDKGLVSRLLDKRFSVFIFSLYFGYYYKRYGSLYKAWVRYNNGQHKHRYAESVYRGYKKVRKGVGRCRL